MQEHLKQHGKPAADRTRTRREKKLKDSRAEQEKPTRRATANPNRATEVHASPCIPASQPCTDDDLAQLCLCSPLTKTTGHTKADWERGKTVGARKPKPLSYVPWGPHARQDACMHMFNKSESMQMKTQV